LKNLITICSLFLFFSCAEKKIEPIGKYKGKGLVVIEDFRYVGVGQNTRVRVKSKDTVFYIYLPYFDAKNLKVGDTIK
jgi:hypothetical protein